MKTFHKMPSLICFSLQVNCCSSFSVHQQQYDAFFNETMQLSGPSLSYNEAKGQRASFFILGENSSVDNTSTTKIQTMIPSSDHPINGETKHPKYEFFMAP